MHRLNVAHAELIKLRQYILDTLPTLTPALNSLSSSPLTSSLCSSFFPHIPTTGKALKAAEDQLDSIICAYVAAYWWYWGTEFNWVLGDATTGYIITPCRNGKD
ncbi:DUF429 domain-containing protein [Moorena sp. SIO3I6]|uniref:DUF429 domain-containing protein n=1 Tax=Moorena sp. SIO3I6 TaxID=2607831 RepID=UPI0013FA702A|nr:DUF429 domain-containing protein [Moorena sp. SIO3I6]NEP27423.1 DUF429 domain-containing protein [Moorena sp. SIO3I6]